MRKHGVLSPQEIDRIEQGEAMGELSYIYGKFVDETVWIGGQATVMESQALTLL